MHTLDKTLVARFLGHLTELEHAAGLDVPALVTGKQTQNGIHKGFARFVFGKAFNVCLDHRDAVLHRITVAVYGVHAESKTQFAVAGGKRVAALVVFRKPQHLRLHFQNSVEVAENGVLNRLNLFAQLLEDGQRGTQFIVHH